MLSGPGQSVQCPVGRDARGLSPPAYIWKQILISANGGRSNRKQSTQPGVRGMPIVRVSEGLGSGPRGGLDEAGTGHHPPRPHFPHLQNEGLGVNEVTVSPGFQRVTRAVLEQLQG